MSKDPIDGFFVGEAPDLMTACRLHGGCGFRVHRVRPIDNGGERGCAINLARGGGGTTPPPAKKPGFSRSGVNSRPKRLTRRPLRLRKIFCPGPFSYDLTFP